MPDYEVQSLAFGGATTWHLTKLVERLDVRAHTCLLYAGHNDRMRSAPRQSLGSLERQEEPQTEAFAYWVDVEDADDYLTQLAQRCGYLVAMEEYRFPDDGEVKAFARLLMRHRDVVHLEAVKHLDTYGPKVVLQDQIHLNPYGHEIFGKLGGSENWSRFGKIMKKRIKECLVIHLGRSRTSTGCWNKEGCMLQILLFSMFACLDVSFIRRKAPHRLNYRNYGESVWAVAEEEGLPYAYLMSLIVLECSGELPCGNRTGSHVYKRLKQVKQGTKPSYQHVKQHHLKEVFRSGASRTWPHLGGRFN